MLDCELDYIEGAQILLLLSSGKRPTQLLDPRGSQSGDGEFSVEDSRTGKTRVGLSDKTKSDRRRLDWEPISFGHWRLIGEFPADMTSGHG